MTENFKNQSVELDFAQKKKKIFENKISKFITFQKVKFT